MTASHPRLSGGRYVVQRCIGTGGMGAVFLAYDDVLKGPRAIKVLKPDLSIRTDVRARFRTEAIAMSKLNHPGIVRVFDQGSEALTTFIVMEYLPAGSLHRWMGRNGPLGLEVALSACLDVADALAHAHDQGVIHRDIKPDNLLIGPDSVKLTDFGLARVAMADGGLTRTQATFGTPSFMPPEQRIDGKKTTGRSDIYALCASLLVLLTGRDPIDIYDPDAREILLDGVEPGVADIIRRGCEADPEDRFPDARALAAALDGARSQPGSPRTRPDASPSETNAQPQDLESLHRLWRSYTTPAPDPTADHIPGGSEDTFFVPDGVSNPPTRTDASVDPEASPASGRASTESDAAEPLAKRQREGGRRAGSRNLLAVGLALMGVGAVAVWQPWTDSGGEAPVHPVEPRSTGVSALLAGNLDGTAQALASPHGKDAPPGQQHALQGILDVLEGRPEAGREGFQRAAAEATAETRHARALRLAGPGSLDGTGPDGTAALLAAWSEVRAEPADPFIDLLFLASWQDRLSDRQLRDEITAARERHPEHAVFDVLRFRLQRDALDVESQQSLLDETAARFPTSLAVQMDRAELLERTGALDAAREALEQSVRQHPEAYEPHFRLADIAGRIHDEAERMTRFSFSISDTVPEHEQARFLLGHGETMAALGRPDEARKLWTARLGIPEDAFPGFVPSTCVLGSRAAVLLRLPPDIAAERSEEARARALAPSSPGSARQRAGWSMALAYDDGVRAARTGATELAESQLEVLRAAVADPDASPATRELLALLEIEMAFADPDATVLASAMQTSRPALAGMCSAHWVDARYGAGQDDPEAVREASEALRTGACRARDLERGIYIAEVLALEAETAMRAGEMEQAETAHAAFVDHWRAPEADVPLAARMAGLLGGR